MKSYYLILFLFMITLQSCQGPKEVTKETVVVSDRSHQTGGTDSVGGGNGTNDKPFESFIVDIETMDSYKLKILPLIEKMKIKFPRLAADFYHLTHQRKWYFVPGQLEQIPKNVLGSYVPSDQMALQDTNKIWIDQLQFEKMSTENQGVLILHELMMGVELLKYKYVADRCIAKAALLFFESTNSDKYDEQKIYCRKTYPLKDVVSEAFNPNDIHYDTIRGLVSDLNQIEPNFKEIESLIEYYKIRDYKD